MNRIREALQPGSWLLAVGEIVLIFALLFVYGGRPAPEVNEAHYLAKSQHYWNPAWCPGDHFLESADAHQSFYWLFGWVTLLVSLPTAAWIGRIVTWGLLAVAWRNLSWAIVPKAGFALLSAALWVGGVEHLHMAGEWVIGGVEAKGFAYALVLFGLERLVRGRWMAVWPLLGAAAGLHVLVGGWGVVAAGLAWLASRERTPLVTMLPALVAGLLLALPGLLPAIWLTQGTSAELVSAANQIYVQGRLAHHLLIESFPRSYIGRNLALLAVFLAFAWWGRRDERLMAMTRFTLGAVIIATVGAGLELALRGQPDLKHALLRFYWYRLSDVILPAGAALAACAVTAQLRSQGARLAPLLQVSLTLIAMLAAGLTLYQDRQHPRPAADQARDVLNEEDWRRVCRWMAENTRPEDTVLTPRFQQTFKWYAGRGEVITYKDVPQDAQGIVQWQQRYRDVRDFLLQVDQQWERLRQVERQRGTTPSQIAARQAARDAVLAAHRQSILDLARRYKFRYIVAIRDWIGPSGGKLHLALEQVYPNNLDRNDHYVVYRVPLPVEEDSLPESATPGTAGGDMTD